MLLKSGVKVRHGQRVGERCGLAKREKTRRIKTVKMRLTLLFPILLVTGLIGVMSCSSFLGGGSSARSAEYAAWIKNSPKIILLRRQVSGRYDGASSWDNIVATSHGARARRSWYGTAPGGYTRLDPRMLWAMRVLAQDGYTYNVSSIAGGSHSRNSRHYAGLSFDVSAINGRKVRWGSPYWRAFLRRCRQLGATETLGPGDRGHSTHIHVAWPR